MKKIFIAGHNGMVGSAVLRKLKNNTNKTVVADKKKLNLLDQKSVLIFFKKNHPSAISFAIATTTSSNVKPIP